MDTIPTPSEYEQVFLDHRNASISQLWPWQSEVLAAYEETKGDAAIELPTGSGKTLVALLVGELFRQREEKPVAYLAGNKQLAQQVERQAHALNLPIVRFQDGKDTWSPSDIRKYNWGQAIAVMNYWNYFNENPGVEPASMLILDDVHLLEGPLRDFFTVTIRSNDGLYQKILDVIVKRFPYYRLAADLLNGVSPPQPPEMLAFPDSAAIADELRDLLDANINSPEDSRWWAWNRIRANLHSCCCLVSGRAFTITPYIPPTQTNDHFAQPQKRLYLSATVGSPDDLQRRLGVPPFDSITATAKPKQGERFVLMRPEVEPLSASELVRTLQPLLRASPKALWLCARGDTADSLEAALKDFNPSSDVLRLSGDNGADERFSQAVDGHLVTAGRYDGMDFPEDACRIEVLPEHPIAISDLEEFITAYLRDAPYAEARSAQRVAQALGRCNRTPDDRAVYVLSDPEFIARFSKRRVISSLPDEVKPDVVRGLERADRPFAEGMEEAKEFLQGKSFAHPALSPLVDAEATASTAKDEVAGMLALWREDYRKAAQLFDKVAVAISQSRETKAFWLAFRALALLLAGQSGDATASTEALAALRAAAATGATSTFFTRLRGAQARITGSVTHVQQREEHDGIFSAWDRLLDRYGQSGPRFERWSEGLVGDLFSEHHDTVAKTIARIGSELLGLASDTPQPTSGEHDAHWELSTPPRMLAFEVKLAPQRERIVNDDVEQAEGSARASESRTGHGTRILIVTPHGDADATAIERLERGRLIQVKVLADEVAKLLAVVREYRQGWTDDARVRSQRRLAVQSGLPAIDWIWGAFDTTSDWIEADALAAA